MSVKKSIWYALILQFVFDWYRFVYDVVRIKVGPLSVKIDAAIVRETKFANQRYRAALEEKRKLQSEGEKRTGLKSKLTTELKGLHAKKAVLSVSVSNEMDELLTRKKEIEIQLAAINR